MALQTSGAISIANISAEFGGNPPYNLSTYYRGKGLVPDSSSNYRIPTSGTVSLSNYYGAVDKLPSTTLLQRFWDNRTRFFRTLVNSSREPLIEDGQITGVKHVGGNFPGDLANVNDHFNRYSSKVLSEWSLSNSSLSAITPDSTVVQWVIGSGPVITEHSSEPTQKVLTYTRDMPNISIRVSTLPQPDSSITKISQKWSRGGSNSGSNGGFFILPGDWRVVRVVDNPVSSSGVLGSYTFFLEPGEILLILVGDHTNQFNTVYPSGTSSYLSGDFWWYNGGIYQVIPNFTTQTQSLTWATITGMFRYSRTFVTLRQSSY